MIADHYVLGESARQRFYDAFLESTRWRVLATRLCSESAEAEIAASAEEALRIGNAVKGPMHAMFIEDVLAEGADRLQNNASHTAIVIIGGIDESIAENYYIPVNGTLDDFEARVSGDRGEH